jgi:RNA polymerase sigma factor (sigma-70 family)
VPALPDPTAEDEAEWPWFLDLLDSDPERAYAGFHRFALRNLHATAFSAMRSIHDDPADVYAEFITECLRGDKLRKYRPQGRPFRNWMLAAAGKYLLSRIRKRVRHERMEQRLAEERKSEPASPDIDRDLLVGLISKLDYRCRVLLILRFIDGIGNIELADRFLNYFGKDNVAVGRTVHRCVGRLRKFVEEADLQWIDFAGRPEPS